MSFSWNFFDLSNFRPCWSVKLLFKLLPEGGRWQKRVDLCLCPLVLNALSFWCFAFDLLYLSVFDQRSSFQRWAFTLTIYLLQRFDLIQLWEFIKYSVFASDVREAGREDDVRWGAKDMLKPTRTNERTTSVLVASGSLTLMIVIG